MYRRGFVFRFMMIGLLFLGAMALFRAGVAHGYMMAASGIEGAPIGPHYPGGYFRPVGFGGPSLFLGFGLILIGLMMLGKGHRRHAWRHHGPRPGRHGYRGYGYPRYPGWWGWYWEEDEEPSSPADRDKGEPAEQKV